jgi:hypothetical protein
VTELVGIDCVNGVIMYNVTTAAAMIAVAQQAIKKAPVTSSFAEEKSQAGLAMWINYDRFSTIGQAFLIIPSPAQCIRETGDGFILSFLSKVSARFDARQYAGELVCVASPPWYDIRDKEEDFWVWLRVAIETKKAKYWQYLAFDKFYSDLHNSLNYRRWQRLRRRAPLLGRGIFVPIAVSGRRIA